MRAPQPFVVAALLGGCLFLSAGCRVNAARTTTVHATPAEVVAWFRGTGKQVLTFTGYSGAGYEDEAGMLDHAARALDAENPHNVIVNIGATADGIGAVYALARGRGFATTGIVSSQAEKAGAALSADVERVFVVEDALWGGIDPATGALSPTSEAMVAVSDRLIGIGGGDVARDEMRAAKAAGKTVRFVPADMNHAKAIAAAEKKGKPAPVDFRGTASEAFR